MTKDQWESLVSSAGWPALKQYLLDYRSNIMEQMADGRVNPDIYPEAVARCQTAKDLAEMDWETIENFYKKPEEQAA